MLLNKLKHTMLQENAEKLAQIIKDIKELERQKDVLRGTILEEMKEGKLTSFKSEAGVVSFISKETYKYTEAVDELKAKVADRQEFEEAKGLATVSVSEYVQMSLPKLTK